MKVCVGRGGGDLESCHAWPALPIPRPTPQRSWQPLMTFGSQWAGGAGGAGGAAPPLQLHDRRRPGHGAASFRLPGPSRTALPLSRPLPLSCINQGCARMDAPASQLGRALPAAAVGSSTRWCRQRAAQANKSLATHAGCSMDEIEVSFVGPGAQGQALQGVRHVHEGCQRRGQPSAWCGSGGPSQPL